MLVDALVGGLVRTFALVRQLPEPDHDPAEVRDLADEIMSRPRYREQPDPLLERISDWLNERLGDLLSGLSLGGALPQFVAWIILGVLVGGAAYLIARSVQAGSWGRASRPAKREADVVLSAEDHRSPGEWLAEAERHEREGRWAEGLLCRYRALVVSLVDREVIAELVGRTAGEYVQDVRAARPDLAAVFAEATGLFEAAWYGGVLTGAEERDRFVSLAASVSERELVS